MDGFTIALWAMTATKQYRPQPVPPAPTAVVESLKPVPVPVDQEALRKAMDRVGRCLTGKLVKDPGEPLLYVPEVDEQCLKASR